MFCKSTDRVVSGAANGFSRGLGFHIHALDHGAWKSDYFQHFSTNVNLMPTRQEYSTENLSGTQKAMLEDLRDYGLIWQRKV